MSESTSDPVLSPAALQNTPPPKLVEQSPAPEAEAAPEDDGSVVVRLGTPWNYSAFRTPALPGVELTPEGVRLPREDAELMVGEALRCGFQVTTEPPLVEHVVAEGAK